jgi:hypothetical protein
MASRSHVQTAKKNDWWVMNLKDNNRLFGFVDGKYYLSK